jgi:hypothetical protein
VLWGTTLAICFRNIIDDRSPVAYNVAGDCHDNMGLLFNKSFQAPYHHHPLLFDMFHIKKTKLSTYLAPSCRYVTETFTIICKMATTADQLKTRGKKEKLYVIMFMIKQKNLSFQVRLCFIYTGYTYFFL